MNKTLEECRKLHISRLRQMVKASPTVSDTAKANRFHLTRSQLLFNLFPHNKELRAEVIWMFPFDI